MKPLFIYITVPTREEARTIATAVVEARLAACANILGPHEAVYRWQGKIETAQETGMILKTRADLFEKLKEKILELHSYDMPCIVALPIEKGHGPFLQWIETETAKN